MKRLLLSLLFIVYCLFFTPVGAYAQAGLEINGLFEGRVIPQERLIETRVRGKTLEKYRLTYYRSVRLSVTEEESLRLHQLIGKDSERSIDMRSYRKSPHRWDTWTCKMQMPPSGNKNCFVCYQEQWNRQHDKCEVTVIYMEGSVASMEELEELLK